MHRWLLPSVPVPFLLAFVLYLGGYLAMQPRPTGDEPHYLLIASSLVHDHDIDLRDDYERRDGAGFYPGLEAGGHAFDYRGDGRLISIHHVGLPILIAPALAVRESLHGVRLLLIVVSAVTAHQLFWLLAELGITTRRVVWGIWIAVVFSSPLLTFSNQIYPDGPAALIVVYGARVLLAKSPSARSLFIASLASATLPWLHVRFLPLAVGIAVAVAYRDFRLRRQPGGTHLLTLFPLPVSLLVLAVAFNSWYGHPLPTAQYNLANFFIKRSAASASGWYTFGVGSLLSPAYGWLPFAPVHWLGLVGLVAFARRYARWALWALLCVGSYVLLVGSAGGAGWSFPGRFLVPIMPLIAVPLLVTLQIGRAATAVFFAGLLAISLSISYVAVTRHDDLYPSANGITDLPIVSSVQEMWPVFQHPKATLRISLQATETPREVGRVVTRATGDDETGTAVAYASPSTDPPGALSFGPYTVMAPGEYVARFTVAVAGGQHGDHVATLDVFTLPNRVFGQKEIRLEDDPGNGRYETFEVPFALHDWHRLEARVYYTGKAEVWLKSIELVQFGAVGTDAVFPSWPKVMLWLVGTAFVAFLFGQRIESGRQFKGDGSRSTSLRSDGADGDRRANVAVAPFSDDGAVSST